MSDTRAGASSGKPSKAQPPQQNDCGALARADQGHVAGISVRVRDRHIGFELANPGAGQLIVFA
jgi:hypothetical protein